MWDIHEHNGQTVNFAGCMEIFHLPYFLMLGWLLSVLDVSRWRRVQASQSIVDLFSHLAHLFPKI